MFVITYFLSTDQHDLKWYRLDFHFPLLDSANDNIFLPINLGCALIIFPVFHSSLPFILYSTTLALLSFFTVVFYFVPVDMQTFIMLSFIFFSQNFIYFIFGNFISFISRTSQFFFPFIPWIYKFFVCLNKVSWMNPVKCSIMSDQYTLFFFIQYFSSATPSLVVLSSIIDSVTCHQFFICINPYIRSQCSPNFFI